MLENDRIDVLQETDVNKTNSLRECIIFHHCYFLEINLRCQSSCDGCHDLMLKAMRFVDIVNVIVKGNDFRIYFLYMSKDEAINVFKKC